MKKPKTKYRKRPRNRKQAGSMAVPPEMEAMPEEIPVDAELGDEEVPIDIYPNATP